MALYISTNMYTAEEFPRVLEYPAKLGPQVGVEVFPLFDQPGYEEILKQCMPQLKKVPVSFHGPYYQAEHSAPAGTQKYRETAALVCRTLQYAQQLDCRYLVYHHNNCQVPESRKAEMERIGCENFREIEALCGRYGISVVVENAGVKSHQNMLFDQEEFIALCRREGYPVLLDIGHAHANGWDLEHVMQELRSQIVSYHLHNNDGYEDGHQRIHNGTLDFAAFYRKCRELTPSADLVLEYSAEVSGDTEGILADAKELLG